MHFETWFSTNMNRDRVVRAILFGQIGNGHNKRGMVTETISIEFLRGGNHKRGALVLNNETGETSKPHSINAGASIVFRTKVGGKRLHHLNPFSKNGAPTYFMFPRIQRIAKTSGTNTVKTSSRTKNFLFLRLDIKVSKKDAKPATRRDHDIISERGQIFINGLQILGIKTIVMKVYNRQNFVP